MHRLRRFSVMVLLIVPAISVAQRGDVSGVAFIDANGNGVRDSGERGLANVVVSNQDAVVASDESGEYRLPRGANGVLFVSVPDGYRTVGAFWRRVDDMTSKVDFPLSPIARSTVFTFIHASDTHLSPGVLARTQRFRALADSLNPAFVIITGDLVKDALRVGETEATGYYELFRREVALFKSPVWTVPGNHENFGIERGKSNVSTAHPLYGRKMYHHYHGPDYYSFNFGGVHFVGLNTVDIDDQWYYGHLDSLQLAWLERDLTMVPPLMPVVTFNHIPFFSSFDGLSGYRDEPLSPPRGLPAGTVTYGELCSMRSWNIHRVPTVHPSSTSPMRSLSGTRTSVRKTSLKFALPVIWRRGLGSTPGACMSSTNIVMPLCLGASGFVRAMTMPQSQ